MAKRVIPRTLALRDLQAAIAWYEGEGGAKVALAFVDAVERSFAAIGRRPSAGANRDAHELDLPGLRCWKVARYPYLVFFMELEGHVEVWRILHSQRDLPASLRPQLA